MIFSSYWLIGFTRSSHNGEAEASYVHSFISAAAYRCQYGMFISRYIVVARGI
jgi:hypothetical protein